MLTIGPSGTRERALTEADAATAIAKAGVTDLWKGLRYSYDG
jgi:hypothetical protein